MKRIVMLFLVSVLFLLAGCTGEATSNEDSNSKPIETTELTGNIFLDAEIKSYPAGNSVIHTIKVDKSAALEASEEDYAEFISERLESSFAEAYALIFDDGTGVLYYGCDPSNAVYGTMRYNGTLIEGYGFLLPNDDGTYSYKAYSD